MQSEYFWVIGGGLLQVPLIEEVKRLGYAVIVSDGSAHCVCRPMADVFFDADIFDIPKHLELAKKFGGETGKIAGVLAAGIDAPETMAAVATSLNLPSVEPEIAHLVNNKHKFRKRLAELGYPVPRFAIVDEDSDLEASVKEIGYPLIVKNTDSSGSRGTRIFCEHDMQGVRETLKAAIGVSRSRKALIEECWMGPEQTVETIFDVNGRFHPCFITDREFDRTDGYALETGLRHPSALPEKTQKEMYELAYNVARDLGVKIGAAKFDMMLTKDGPRIIEMTVRLSGGFDSQYLVPAATGKNVMKAAILTALGKPFSSDLLQDRRGRVGVTASIWPKPGKIKDISGVNEAKGLPGFEQIFFRYQVGDTISPYFDCTKRVCFVIATGETEPEARAQLKRILDCIEIETG